MEVFNLIDNTSWTDVLTAIGTVGAVLISIGLTFYKEWWEPKWRKARLSISIDPLYSFAVDSSWDAINDRQNAERYTSGKVKLRVEHIKGNSAKNVEVFISKVWEIENGKKKQREYFFPTSILWSGKKEEQKTKADFAPSIVRFCDLGIYAFNWESEEWEFHIATSDYTGDPMVEKFSNVLPDGVYELEILITGEGVEPTTSNWRLEISGGWSENEKVMFSEHFKIRKV